MLKKPLLLVTLSLTLSTELLFSTLVANAMPSGTTVAQFRPPTAQPRFKPRRRSILKFKVSNIRASKNREGGAARGDCSPKDISAIISPKSPNMKTDKGIVPVELTLRERPTFFVNVPDTSAQLVAFLLRDESGKQILVDKVLPLKATKGILAYTLPADFQGLEVGKIYRWRFSLLCDATGEDRSGDVNASGWIKRIDVPPTVAQKLETGTEIERVAVYADNGYWPDTLKALLDLRIANPNDEALASDWSSLFQSVNLPSLAQQPVIQIDTNTVTSATQ